MTGRPVLLLPRPEPVVFPLGVLVGAALANLDILENIRLYPHVWTVEGQRRSPTVRVEYEHTVVIGHVGEALAAARSKRWGPVVGVFPLKPDDPVHPMRILYIFKDSNPYQKRFMQRRYMRGKAGRKAVNLAFGARLGWFLKRPEAAAAGAALGLSPRAFWRAVNGLDVLDVGRQVGLFDEIEDRSEW